MQMLKTSMLFITIKTRRMMTIISKRRERTRRIKRLERGSTKMMTSWSRYKNSIQPSTERPIRLRPPARRRKRIKKTRRRSESTKIKTS